MIKATKMQRFFATVIDLVIITVLVNLCVRGFSKIVHFDVSNMNEYLQGYLQEIQHYVDSILNDTVFDTTLMMQYLKEYFKYFFVNLGFKAMFSAIFITLYLVVLPMFWDKQTLGRFIMKAKVMRKDESKVTIKNLLLRELVGTCLLYTLLGGFSIYLATLILILCNSRSLADYIGGTSLFSTIDNGTLPEKNYTETPNRDEYIDAKFKDVSADDSVSEKKDDEYRVF